MQFQKEIKKKTDDICTRVTKFNRQVEQPNTHTRIHTLRLEINNGAVAREMGYDKIETQDKNNQQS